MTRTEALAAALEHHAEHRIPEAAAQCEARRQRMSGAILAALRESGFVLLDRESIRRVLIENGVESTENQGLHGWRCRYPESYGRGPCDCFASLMDDLMTADAILGADE